jgi:hypothetical protein
MYSLIQLNQNTSIDVSCLGMLWLPVLTVSMGEMNLILLNVDWVT